MKILVVEDEIDLNSVITKHLKKNGYSVDSAYDGEEALDYLRVAPYDLVIADIMMPKMDGFSLIKKLREQGHSIPVLVLTAKDATEDKVLGLDLGADDYVVKPFEFDELLARVRALMRRHYGSSDNLLVVDDLEMNIAEISVTRAGKHIDLTAKEYEILQYLMHNKGKVITRQQLQDHVWDFSYEGYSNTIDVLIKNIRKKIDLGDSKPLIFTKRGLGYVIRESEE